MIIAAKLLTALFAFLWMRRIYQAVRLGRTERIDQRFANRGWIPEEHREKAIAAYRYLWCTIVSAMALNFLSSHGPMESRITFAIHLPCAVALLLLMSTMLYYKNGMQDPRTHRRLAYGVIGLSPIVFVTGMALIVFA